MKNDELDGLIDNALGSRGAPVPDHLLKRVLIDAQTVARGRTPAAPRHGPGTALAATILAMLGGWQGGAALAASLVLGVGLGIVEPGMLDGWPSATEGQVVSSGDAGDAGMSLDGLGLDAYDIGMLEL